MRAIALVVFCWLMASAADAAESVVSRPQVVTTSSGPVRGVEDGAAISFKGLPYAAPPVGALRWAPPAPVKPWTEVRDASTYAKACPQAHPLVTGGTLEWSEDCLYLNVWTPAGARGASTDEQLPVMVWIHGGGLVNGSGAMPLYSGARLAADQRVMVVTINYRLAQLGFFAHPALGSGNQGLLDQLAALRWVHENAAAFGGDPSNVTIFGESAGGLSVCTLLATPRAQGLFHRAIIESAGCPEPGKFALRLEGAGGALAQGERVAKALGCDGAKNVAVCLRGKSAQEVLDALPAKLGLYGDGERYGFVVDGHVLPEAPGEAVAHGRAAKVPVMLGTTADEDTLFTHGKWIGEWKYRAAVRAIFVEHADEVLQRFPPDRAGSPHQTFDALMTRAVFTCQARRLSKELLATSPAVYRYVFDETTPMAERLGLGATHGSELAFVFGTLRPGLSDGAHALSDWMGAYWASFARSGRPAASGAVAWPTVSADADRYLVLSERIHSGTGEEDADCDFLDGVRPTR